MTSTTITKKHRAQLAKSNGEPSGDAPARKEYEVIEPGPTPPTYVEVAKGMLTKITTNSPAIIDALIKLAAGGHYQAAQYLLNEMKTLNEELKHTDEQSVVELFRPVIERLNAKYRKPTAIDTDCNDLNDTDSTGTTETGTAAASADNRDNGTEAAPDPARDPYTDAYTNAATFFGRTTLPPAEAQPTSAPAGVLPPPITERAAECYCGSECNSCGPSSDPVSNDT